MVSKKIKDKVRALVNKKGSFAAVVAGVLGVGIGGLADVAERVWQDATKGANQPAAPVPGTYEPQIWCHDCDRGYMNITGNKFGQIVCRDCGCVLGDHSVYHGTAFRRFADQPDRNTHGPAHNGLYSIAYNLETSSSTPTVPSTKSDTTTSEQYKNQQIKNACSRIKEVITKLQLNAGLTERACALFAAARWQKEKLQAYEETLAVCIIVAYLEVVEEERPGEVLRFECPECKIVFNCSSDRDRHVASEHEKPCVRSSSIDVKMVNRINDEKELIEWLRGISQGAASNAESVVSELKRVIKERGVGVTLGQELMVTSLPALRSMCGDASAPAKDIWNKCKEITSALKKKRRLHEAECHDRVRKKRQEDYETKVPRNRN